MSNVDDFYSTDNCDKIDPLCVNAYVDFKLDQDNDAGVCLNTSWGGECLDLTSVVKAAETCTSIYLSPEENPNCLVYEPEEKCGDNICIHGDDLSRIISMQYLKDVDQSTPPSDGIVYMYDNQSKLFKPYDLKTIISNINTAIQNINATLSNHENRITNNENSITNHENRISTVEEKLTPPSDAPSGVKVVFGNINDYSDPNVVINEGTGVVTTLDKTHGLYTHKLSDSAYGDEIFG